MCIEGASCHTEGRLVKAGLCLEIHKKMRALLIEFSKGSLERETAYL